MREPFANDRQRLAGIRQLPAHQHHQAESKEEEHQPAEAILNSDHFVVGGKDIFSPPPELVMLVRVRFVMGVNGSRSIHFRRKLRWLISEEKPSLQSEKFQITREKRPVVSGLRCAKFPRAKRTESTSDHPPRYGLLLARDRA